MNEEHWSKSYRNMNEELEAKITRIEQELKSTRDIARDTLHIAIGVDGRNGIRGSLNDLTHSVSKINEDFLFLRETANNYKELKGTIGRFLLSSLLAFVIQFAGIIWFFANEYATKENLKLQILSVLEDVRELKKTTKPVL
jgi:hypothetical protein